MGKILDKLFNGEPISTAASPAIDKIYKTVCELCTTRKEENIAFAHGYITELIHWIYSNSETRIQQYAMDTLQRMLSVINEKEGVTSLSEIGETLHLDKHYLCRLFKEKTGSRLSDYLADKVLAKSRKLLDGTSYSIEEIALVCGFSSQASLTRFFKSKSGITPSQYRKKSRNNVKYFPLQ